MKDLAMRDKVLGVIGKVFRVSIEELNDEASPDTIDGWDSLKHMNLILALEEELGMTFSDDEVVEMLSVRRILETVAKRASQDSHVL
jgi:acyl carrier protein